MSGSSLANIRRTHTTELEEFFCRVLEEALNSHPDLLSLAVALPSKRGVEQHSGAAAFCKGSPGSSSWWREAAPSAQCRARRRIPAPSSSMWNLQLAANGVFFADCVTLSFLRRKQGNSALFAWVSHPSPWLRTHCAVRWTAPFWFTALIMFYSRNMVLMSKLMGKILLRSNNIL